MGFEELLSDVCTIILEYVYDSIYADWEIAGKILEWKSDKKDIKLFVHNLTAVDNSPFILIYISKERVTEVFFTGFHISLARSECD